MDLIYLVVLGFLFVLAVIDLSVGVANDAVNFLSPAVGARAAKFRTILVVATVGILVGASTSSGMMDIARHGILNPSMYSFEQVMRIFLSVVATDVILLDIFNMLGMPTSTTVSMVFGLLGGSTALAMVKLIGGGYTFAQLINTDKALSVILGIFLSVAIAFVFGFIVMWIARIVFTFNYKRHMRWSIALFGGLSITSIVYFLLVSGLGTARFMTPEVRTWISSNQMAILIGCFVIFTVLVEILHLLRVNIFKVIVLFGTFALAMAFAGNDLVNFIGVPLAGLESYQDYAASGAGSPSTHMMEALWLPSTTSTWFLVGAGVVMMIAIFRSKKARKVIDTSVNLARQDEGDEVFSSSRIARRMVRNVLSTNSHLSKYVPRRFKGWVNGRFNTEEAVLADGVAFDLVRASVNLVLAGLLIVVGTSLQLPLSTTYVAFMVAMGSSLADRAWGRETAVYRITGVITVIGGWFITAGAAFIVSFGLTMLNYFGGFIAMACVMALVVFALINSNRKFKKKQEEEKVDTLFREMVRCHDKQKSWQLLVEHVRENQASMVLFAKEQYGHIIDGLIGENIRELRHAVDSVEDEKAKWKRYRRKEIIGMRKIDYLQAVEKNTWFHLGCNSCTQLIYCLKRMLEPCVEHVDNNFTPLSKAYVEELRPVSDAIMELFGQAADMIRTGDFSSADHILVEGNALKSRLSRIRENQQDRIQREDSNIKVDLLYLSTLQESQELISAVRHLLRASRRFQS